MNQESSVPFNWRSPFDLRHPAGGALSGFVAGLIAGVCAGLAGRLVMRIAALASGGQPVFTIKGTLFILGQGILFGVLLGMIFGFFQPFFSGSFLKKGMVYGVFWSAMIVLIMLNSQENSSDTPIRIAIPLITLFASLPILYGAILGLVTRRLIAKDQWEMKM